PGRQGCRSGNPYPQAGSSSAGMAGARRAVRAGSEGIGNGAGRRVQAAGNLREAGSQTNLFAGSATPSEIPFSQDLHSPECRAGFKRDGSACARDFIHVTNPLGTALMGAEKKEADP